MQTGRTNTIGVMIPPYDSFWVSVLSGIHDALSAADYLPITVWTGNLDRMPHFEEGDVEGKKLINRLLDRRVDGLIMWPAFSLAYYHHFPEFVERRVPVTPGDGEVDGDAPVRLVRGRPLEIPGAEPLGLSTNFAFGGSNAAVIFRAAR